MDETGKAGTQDLIAKLVGNGDEAFELDLSSGGYAFAEFNGGNRANATTLYSENLNEWAHLAVTYDGAVVRLYVNGLEEATIPAVFSISTNNQPLGIGSDSAGDRKFQGQMDDVRVYNVALSGAEIAALAGLTAPDSADLSITKTDGQTEADAGDPVTYMIVVSNAGPDDVAGATVSDAFPAEVVVTGWTCVASGGASCTSSGSGDIEDTVDLPAGSSVTFTVTGNFEDGINGPVDNMAFGSRSGWCDRS